VRAEDWSEATLLIAALCNPSNYVLKCAGSLHMLQLLPPLARCALEDLYPTKDQVAPAPSLGDAHVQHAAGSPAGTSAVAISWHDPRGTEARPQRALLLRQRPEVQALLWAVSPERGLEGLVREAVKQ